MLIIMVMETVAIMMTGLSFPVSGYWLYFCQVAVVEAAVVIIEGQQHLPEYWITAIVVLNSLVELVFNT